MTHVLLSVDQVPLAVQQVGDGAEVHPSLCTIDPVCPAGQPTVRLCGAGAGPQTGAQVFTSPILPPVFAQADQAPQTGSTAAAGLAHEAVRLRICVCVQVSLPI